MRDAGALALAVATVAALAAGCDDDDATSGDSEEQLIVSAASSLEPAFTAYAEATGVDAKQSFAGSDELAAQIRQGVKPDLYAAANTSLPDELHAEGLVTEPIVFASNRLVLAVPAGSDAGIESVDDLAGEGLTLAIGDEGVPVGDYTREVLSGLGDAEAAAILDNVRSLEPDVAGIVGKLSQGAVDAGFVYITDVVATRDELEAIELPAKLQPEVAYGAAVVDGAENPDGAREFLDGLLDGAGAEALNEAGFGPPRPAEARGANAVSRRGPFPVVLTAALAVVLCFLILPVLAIFVDAGPGELLDSLGEEQSREALWLSLRTTLAALAIIVLVGTPAAYLLATREFRGKAAVTTAIELPLVLPPAVAGIGLLAAFGPEGIFGGWLEDAGIELVLQTAGVVLALTFVAAPFYLRQAQAAFAAVDPSLLEAARTLGAGEARAFARVAIPCAGPGISAGMALAWGRALGEFGATLMFAGSFPGITQTAPLAIFAEFSTDFTAALALSAVLVAVSAAILLSVKLLGRSAVLGGAQPLTGGD